MTRPVDRVLVGTVIVRLKNGVKQILLLKRRADSDHCQNLFEFPAGCVHNSDQAISAAAFRIVADKTGLMIAHFMAELPTLTRIRPKRDHKGRETSETQRELQLNYLVTVRGDGEGLEVNRSVYSVGVWIEARDVDKIPMVGPMRAIARAAFHGPFTC